MTDARPRPNRLMRRGVGVLAWLTVAPAILLLAPVGARAQPVTVLGPGGHSQVRDDPFLHIPASAEPRPGSPQPRAHRATLAAGPTASAAARGVGTELNRLRRTGQIDQTQYASYSAGLSAALSAARGLVGTRRAELVAVIGNLHTIAATGQLTPSRLPALFLTLDRNRQWWSTGPLLASGQRVQFGRSQLVWEYYPGQGIELQELGTFGQVDWMYQAGPRYYPRIRNLLDEIIPLAAHRGGGLAWEYYFNFDGGTPPWTSAMSQGTAIQALTQASEAFQDKSYLSLAHRALPIFWEPPPLGVAVSTPRGRRYLLYSFAPGAPVINGFLQSLVGLFDYAQVSANPLGARLFHLGDVEARAELPSYDTGAWSLYQPGEEDDLNYHQVVTGFLGDLCSRTGARGYCDTAARFTRYLKTPTTIRILTTTVPSRRPTSIWFWISKVSRVGVTLVRHGQTAFSTSATFHRGAGAFAIGPLPGGGYQTRIDATDLAGNYNRLDGALRVKR